MKDLRCWVEVDRKNIAKNIRMLKSELQEGTEFLVVVKGDGYGHGIVESAKIALSEGASLLGVAYLEEAKILREAKIKGKILLLTQPQVSEIPQIFKLNVIPTIISYEFAKKLNSVSKRNNNKLLIHIKLDTGFNRLGIKETDAYQEIRRINMLSSLSIEGFYTHFASATNENLEFTKKQFAVFMKVINTLKEEGIVAKYLHVANSPAFVWFQESQLNLVRFGLAVFGLQPSSTRKYPLPIRCCLQWKTRILQVKNIKKGEFVGYDNTWMATKNTRIATIAVGYSDGFRQAPKNYGYVLCKGKKHPVIGKVSMSLATIEIGLSSNIKVGDEVVIIGTQNKLRISPEDISKISGVSNEEIVTTISKDLPRVYLSNLT